MTESAADREVAWHTDAVVRGGFGWHRFATRFVLPFLPPITARSLVAWGTFPVLLALMVAWVWYANVHFAGHGSTPTTIRWMAYICGALVVIFGGLLPSRGVDSPQLRAATQFRPGDAERALVRGGRYGLRRGKLFVSVRLGAVRKVRRFNGVAALELASGRYWIVPQELFPDDGEWVELQRRYAPDALIGGPGPQAGPEAG